jgi:hypothetical protein
LRSLGLLEVRLCRLKRTRTVDCEGFGRPSPTTKSGFGLRCRSSLPSLLKSPTAMLTDKGPPVRESIRGRNVPSPLLRNIETRSAHPEHLGLPPAVTAISRFPSPLKSPPTTTAESPQQSAPPPRFTGGWKVPSPFPKSTLTASNPPSPGPTCHLC